MLCYFSLCYFRLSLLRTDSRKPFLVLSLFISYTLGSIEADRRNRKNRPNTLQLCLSPSIHTVQPSQYR